MLAVGVLSAFATLGLIALIRFSHSLFFSGEIGTGLATLPWWQILLVPALGGLIVGLMLYRSGPDGRFEGVSDVMEAAAMRGGNMDYRKGILSATATVVSLGTGASLGREGPAIHVCATVSAWLANTLRLDKSDSLILLGGSVAAAVTTSFNAPIAGVLFALEVVVGYYSLRVLTPTVISTIGAVIVTRQMLGDSPAFHLPPYTISSFWELPAFALIGVAAGVVALTLIHCVRGTHILWNRSGCPNWLRPMFGGLFVGAIALQFPLVLGVGYEATDMALRETLPVAMLVMLLALKLLATGVCFGSGFAGGIFSPALFMGAMLGGAFWWFAAGLFPALASSQGAYSIVGMAGVASALLGAPISTLLIIFELTADYHLVAAVMLASAVASTCMQYSRCKSFFRWQLEQRGINLNQGRNQSLLVSNTVEPLISQKFSRVGVLVSVGEARRQLVVDRGAILLAFDGDRFMGSISLNQLLGTEISDHPDSPLAKHLDGREFSVTHDTSLNGALELLNRQQTDCVPAIATEGGNDRVLGVVYRADILHSYNAALRDARDKEYGIN